MSGQRPLDQARSRGAYGIGFLSLTSADAHPPGRQRSTSRSVTGVRRGRAPNAESCASLQSTTGVVMYAQTGLSSGTSSASILCMIGAAAEPQDSRHRRCLLCRAWAGFDLVAEDEVGAGIAGAGGGELVAERGQGLGAAGRERVEPDEQFAVTRQMSPEAVRARPCG